MAKADKSSSPERERVNHPPHYNQHPSGVECITVVEHMSFNVGNAIKYLWRAGLKAGVEQTEDLKKAQWYIQREIGRCTSLRQQVESDSGTSYAQGDRGPGADPAGAH